MCLDPPLCYLEIHFFRSHCMKLLIHCLIVEAITLFLLVCP